jgi:hypothetical protein
MILVPESVGRRRSRCRLVRMLKGVDCALGITVNYNSGAGRVVIQELQFSRNEGFVGG